MYYGRNARKFWRPMDQINSSRAVTLKLSRNMPIVPQVCPLSTASRLERQ